MADWGADVIKIEPATGDDYRTNWNVYSMPGESDLYNPCFDLVGVNKRFVVIDLRTDEGKEILYKMLEDANAFITSARDKAQKSSALTGKRFTQNSLNSYTVIAADTANMAL